MPWILRMLLIVLPFILLAHGYGYVTLARLRHHLTFLNTRGYVWALRFLYIWWLSLPVVSLVLFAVGSGSRLRSLTGEASPLDFLLIYPFWLGLIFSVELLPFLMMMDLSHLIMRKVGGAVWQQWLAFRYPATLVLAAGLLVYVPIRCYLDLQSNRIVKRTVFIQGLPTSLDGLRIVHISDLQADGRITEPRIRKYVQAINRIKPDLVIFTGDLITRGRENIPVGARMMGEIRAPYGVYACMGDHDSWTDPQLVRELLIGHGVTFLEDTATAVQLRGEAVLLAGATNIYRRPFPIERIESLAGDGVNTALKILMTHQPSPTLVQKAAESGFDLFLAGHTHGGQVVFWNWLWPFTPPRLETPYWQGFHRVDRMLVGINNGLGLTAAPVRYHAPASVNVIEVRGAPSPTNGR